MHFFFQFGLWSSFHIACFFPPLILAFIGFIWSLPIASSPLLTRVLESLGNLAFFLFSHTNPPHSITSLCLLFSSCRAPPLPCSAHSPPQVPRNAGLSLVTIHGENYDDQSITYKRPLHRAISPLNRPNYTLLQSTEADTTQRVIGHSRQVKDIQYRRTQQQKAARQLQVHLMAHQKFYDFGWKFVSIQWH